ncbi:MAG: DUF928 domain-containing protein [Prochloraceae cyanobacterium]
MKITNLIIFFVLVSFGLLGITKSNKLTAKTNDLIEENSEDRLQVREIENNQYENSNELNPQKAPSRFDELFEGNNQLQLRNGNNDTLEIEGLSGARNNEICPSLNKSPIAYQPNPQEKEVKILSQYPEFSFKIFEPTIYPIRFSVAKQNLAEPLFDIPVDNQQTGILTIKTPEHVKLQEDNYYVATLTIFCNPKRPSLNKYVRYPFYYNPALSQ